jgi:hypothetical protein
MKLSRKQIIITILCPLVILAILFFWRELDDLSTYKKINHEKLSNFFSSLFTLYGTIAAIYFAYNQNKIAKENNSSTIRPYLVPENSSFKMKDLDIQFEVSRDEKLYLTFPVPVSGDGRLGVKTKNKGVGAAKNICVDWKYNKTEVNKIVKGVYHPNNIKTLPNPEIIPAGETDFLSLPNYYLTCCGHLINKHYPIITNIPIVTEADMEEFGSPELKEKLNKLIPNLKPELLLVINYTDLQGRSYSNEYQVALENDEGNEDNFTFQFQAKS